MDMSADLRADFKEIHRKCLYAAIDVVPLPAKKDCQEKTREETERETLATPMPQSNVMGLSSAPAIEEEVGPALGGPLMVPLQLKKSWIRRTLLHPLLLLVGMK